MERASSRARPPAHFKNSRPSDTIHATRGAMGMQNILQYWNSFSFSDLLAISSTAIATIGIGLAFYFYRKKKESRQPLYTLISIEVECKTDAYSGDGRARNREEIGKRERIPILKNILHSHRPSRRMYRIR